MKTRGLTYKHAQAFKQQILRLLPELKKVADNERQKIEDILVAPTDMLSKWNFFNQYLELRDSETALQRYIHHSYYDVIAIIRLQQEDGEAVYTYRDLDVILQDNIIWFTKSFVYDTME